MSNKDLSRNASGYYDPTAYNAIINTIKSERINKVNDMKQGEIWEIKMNNGTYKDVIVLAVHEDITQVLQLGDISNNNSIEVKCQGIKYTDPRRVMYTFNDTFLNFIRVLKTEEFEQIVDAVAYCLGFSTTRIEEPVEPVDLPAGPDCFIPISAEGQTVEPFDLEIIKDSERARAERDVYKGLYEKLLESVMKGA